MKWYLRPLSRYVDWIIGSGDLGTLDLLRLFYYIITGMMAMALVPMILIRSIVDQTPFFPQHLPLAFIILAILGIPNAICMVILRFDLLEE